MHNWQRWRRFCLQQLIWGADTRGFQSITTRKESVILHYHYFPFSYWLCSFRLAFILRWLTFGGLSFLATTAHTHTDPISPNISFDFLFAGVTATPVLFWGSIYGKESTQTLGTRSELLSICRKCFCQSTGINFWSFGGSSQNEDDTYWTQKLRRICPVLFSCWLFRSNGRLLVWVPIGISRPISFDKCPEKAGVLLRDENAANYEAFRCLRAWDMT